MRDRDGITPHTDSEGAKGTKGGKLCAEQVCSSPLYRFRHRLQADRAGLVSGEALFRTPLIGNVSAFVVRERRSDDSIQEEKRAGPRRSSAWLYLPLSDA